MQKQIKIKTKFGTKTFNIQSGGKEILVLQGTKYFTRQYLITDENKNCLGTMMARTVDGELVVYGCLTKGTKKQMFVVRDLGRAKTHEQMFARIIRKTAKRAA